MSYNLKNRSFLKEIDPEPSEVRFLLKLSEALKLAKYAGTETRRLSGRDTGMTSGLEVTGEVFGSSASIVFD